MHADAFEHEMCWERERVSKTMLRRQEKKMKTNKQRERPQLHQNSGVDFNKPMKGSGIREKGETKTKEALTADLHGILFVRGEVHTLEHLQQHYYYYYFWVAGYARRGPTYACLPERGRIK